MREYRAVPGEVDLYERAASRAQFRDTRQVLRRMGEDAYVPLLQQVARVKEGADWKKIAESLPDAQAAARKGQHGSDVGYWIKSERSRSIDAAWQKYEKSANDSAAHDELKQTVNRAHAEAEERLAAVEAVEGRGLFEVFFEYQRLQVRNVVDGVASGNWLGGLGRMNGPDGVYTSAFKFFTQAPAWAFQYHWLYFLLYGALFLVVWSLFGGAIARIAAVHVADEGRKLSMRQGLSFAVSKFLSFLSAPLIPAIIVLGIGLVVAIIAGAAFAVYVLDWAVGAFYFLALAAGFVMTLVVLGTAGGLNLMYPTIAVEGSDSFDAISRSFSYVYAKPWRMLFYSTVAIAYGALCYLFVRVFLWLMLLLTNISVGLLVFRDAANMGPLWQTIQPMPGVLQISSRANFDALNWYGDVTAGLVSVWIYMAVALLGAFAISFYFSASTIIYYLIRRDTDATEMDDVYLEEPEEDFAEAGAAVAGGRDTVVVGEGGVIEPAPAGAAASNEPPSPSAGSTDATKDA
jgi:hypothetical protein